MNFDAFISEHIHAISSVKAFEAELLSIFELSKTVLWRGNKILIAGNGGSAADAQHFAAELTGRFEINRNPKAALALTTDSSAITAIANDFGFEYIFSRQVEALGNSGDILLVISTSGNSPNLLKAVEVASAKGLITVGLLGKDGGKLNNMLNHAIVVPSLSTARIQETHLFIEHLWCSYLDKT